ncbi:ABC transporter substrate-binding protein [Salipiger sp. IMCC34102]|uniref:ABC transporter substrate-binding protein n=1 Tax=Salipiger sp. IMCC34102 TaxID=2510647 RepID=UPI00101DCA7C|nr:ABC transporter substrate-binding protein [Salipiger sp. IMCC34102]RYH02543.1 ABC transporter substrate-binding protein [Salipiger sp. IMCC34102]
MNISRRTLLTAASTVALLAQPMAAAAQDLPRNVRMVIGSSSTGGDTYQNASILADALSDHLGVNIRVDPVGASEAFKALARDSRGTTIMMHHDQSYLQELYGVEGSPDIFAETIVGPTISVNPGNAYLVPADSPYESMEDILAAAEAGERVRVAIQPGGVSEIGFTAMRNAARMRAPGSEENIVAVNTGDQADKNQAMWDDLADVINGSIQANEQFTQMPPDDPTAMRFIWITATPETLNQAPEEGLGETTREDMLTFAAPAVSVPMTDEEDFTFDKEFFLMFNPDTDPAIIETIDTAMEEIYAEGEIQDRFLSSFFTPDYRPMAEAQEHLQSKNDDYETIISDLKPE